MIVVPAPGQMYKEPAYGIVTFMVDFAVALQVCKYARCCEVEFQYKNTAGAWTANKPVVVENPGLISAKSPLPVSQFKASTDWRMRVRTFDAVLGDRNYKKKMFPLEQLVGIQGDAKISARNQSRSLLMNLHRSVIVMFQVIATAAVLASAPGHAGKIVTAASKEGGQQNIETLEFNEKGQLRVTSNGLDSVGMIARDNRLYFFGELKGKPAVVDLLAAVKKLNDQGMKRPESDPAAEEIAEIKPVGRKETIAGIEGEVHTVTWVLAGNKRTEEIVLTRDPRLAAVIKSLGLDPGLTSNKPRKAVLKEEVSARGYFLLKSHNSLVTALDFSPTPDERFVLKAVPGDNVDTVFEIMMSTALGVMGAAVGGVADAVGKAMSEAVAEPRPEPETPPESLEPTLEEANRQLLEISPAFGLQLKAPPIPDYAAAGWTALNVGELSMFTPPGWTLSEQETREEFIPSAGLVSPGNYIFIELRFFRDTPRRDGIAFEEARDGYASANDRRKDGIMLGYTPVNVDGSFGHIEIMNSGGREKNEDGSLSFRMNIFRGAKRVGESILKAEFRATFAQADQAKLGPTVLNIIRSIQFKNIKIAK